MFSYDIRYKYIECLTINMNNKLLPKITANVKRNCKKRTAILANYAFANVTSNHRGMSKLALKKRYVSELDADIRNDVIDDSLQTTYDKLKFTTPVINQLREELRILMLSISEFEYISNGRYSKLLSTSTGIKKLMYELFTGRGIFKDENIQYEISNSIEKEWKMIGDKLFKLLKT